MEPKRWYRPCGRPLGGNAMRILIGALLLSMLPATNAVAKPKHWHEDERHSQDRDDDRGPNCYFRHDDVRIIREYYEPRYQPLPPGIAKKYYRTGHLPPGWEKKMQPLPVVVERQLVALPPDYRR